MKTLFSSSRSPISSLGLASVFLALPMLTACEDPAPTTTPEPTANADDPIVEEPQEPTGPLAMIYPSDPVTDGQPVETAIPPPTSEDGGLSNDFVNAKNCLNQAGGVSVMGFATLCVEENTAFPDEEGNYTGILPPASDNDGEDTFAEVQMYHHVNIIHDYFRNTHGHTDLDFPLDAVVNLNINYQGSWQSFPNAAFMPAESFTAFGLPPRDGGAIMFGQGDGVDFSYDASVIYHEYTHAVVGTERLQGTFADSYGLNNLPGAINEGLADYFSSTVRNSPIIGRYALAFANAQRDLSSPRSCPEDLTTEIHADGKIISTALWRIRDALGADVTDGIVFRALMSANQATGLEEIGQLVLAEAKLVSADAGNSAEVILNEQGVIGCERANPWVDVQFDQTAEGVPHAVEGTQAAGATFPDGVPGYLQWYVNVPAGQAVTLSWDLSAGGGFFGGAPEALDLAVRNNEPISLSPTMNLVADQLIDGGDLDASLHQSVTLAGACLPPEGQRLYVTFRNTASAAANVAAMQVAFVDANTDGALTCE